MLQSGRDHVRVQLHRPAQVFQAFGLLAALEQQGTQAAMSGCMRGQALQRLAIQRQRVDIRALVLDQAGKFHGFGRCAHRAGFQCRQPGTFAFALLVA